MQPPRINPRRLFWSMTGVAFLWAMIGGRSAVTPSPHANPSAMQKTQGFFGETVSMLLTPAKFVFTGVQSVGAWAVDRVAITHTEHESITSLHQQIDALNDQIDQRDRQIRLDQEKFLQINAMAPQGLGANELLPASVTGYQAGPGSSVVTLDKGSSDGVQRGMVVTACAVTALPETGNTRNDAKSGATALVPQASILGMVDTVLGKTCTVRLLTDPRMKTLAVLVRRLPEGSAVLTPQPCLVEGMGDGVLRCNTINVGDTLAEPQRGDLVQLADVNWPANVRYMVIGEVTEVGRKDTQLLRYDLTIAPRVNISSVQTVLIVLKQ